MKKGIVAGLASLLLLAGSSAFAEEPAMGPCKADMQKLCAGVEPGHGRVWDCLKQHKDHVSPACKEKIEHKKEMVKEKADACNADREKFCKDVKPGKGHIHKCLKKHDSELSPECKAMCDGKKED
ncbi:MAG: cysteine rich repeat-containing protein [Deltaproteobacteria bacterium]|nr:cysteine rich repeat-containing protein [Deltaproteobacteria bacterium]